MKYKFQVIEMNVSNEMKIFKFSGILFEKFVKSYYSKVAIEEEVRNLACTSIQ